MCVNSDPSFNPKGVHTICSRSDLSSESLYPALRSRYAQVLCASTPLASMVGNNMMVPQSAS